MKKVAIAISVIVLMLVLAITAGIIWEKDSTANEAKQREKDAGFYAEQQKIYQESKQKQAEYNRSVGRPDDAN